MSIQLLFVITFTVQPSISSVTYDGDSHTLTCVYTGSPATTVSWEKDGVPLSIDGSSYQLTQTVTDRASSTHSIVLTVSETAPTSVAGSYSCTVSNQIGSDQKSVTVIGRYYISLYLAVVLVHVISSSCIAI